MPRGASAAGGGAPVASIGGTRPRSRRPDPEVAAEDSEFDWERVAVFAAGIALGAMLGAGAALLTAPLSGAETRRMLRRGARKAAWRGRDAWEDLRDELAWATARKKKQLRRMRRARTL